ncbi:transglutaminase domain-containing protein [Reinekea marina]|uniref:Transglutaminase domain-containing protein n=2 Tax=Reinekea marina TaxID=1310421 RepID=A0ABV7WS96_9GAMM
MYQYAYYSPAAVVIELNQAQLNSLRYGPALEEQTPLDELGTTLQSVKELTNLTLSGVDDYQESKKLSLDEVLQFMGVKTDAGMNLTELETKLDRIIELETVALDSFNDMHEYLIEIDADSVIFERHDAAVEKFKTAMQPVKDIRSAFNTAGSLDEQQRLLNELDDYLSTQQFKKTHTAEDFENGSLPFGPRNLQAREPLLDLSSLESSLYDPVNVASNSLTQDILRGLTAPSPEPNAEDLAETEEAPQTQEIIDLAESLNNDPVEIYNWVYNNIYSIPSYGAIQGAQYTMDLKAGNPFDTSALLLALLRAAGTPARYAYGTIQVPVEQAMNWVGGAEVPEAATNVMLQGGIPTVLQSYNGEITHVKMEHIWVEAWVDYEPSRGLVNNEGDHWIPMDASFKQYDFEAGMDLKSAVPFDAEGLINDLMATGTVDEQAGYVQGLDQSKIQQALSDYQSVVEAYINNQTPTATVGEVLGLQQLPIKQRGPLDAGLQYQVVDRASQIQAIPDSLKQKFRIKLDYDSWGSNALDETYNTVSLAGKNIAISFEPATQSDIDLITSYLPKLQENGDIDITKFPDQLPGYLIHVTPELTIDGETITSLNNIAMGTELTSYYAMYDPSFGWSQSKNRPIAGEYIAIGLDLQGIAPTFMENLQKDIKKVGQDIEDTNITGLDKHLISGKILQSVLYSYFAFNNIHDELSSRNTGQLIYRAPSYGQFHNNINSQYWFGIPRNVSFPGVTMDIDRLAITSSDKSNDHDLNKAVNQSNGMRMSFLENWIPEVMLSTNLEQLDGISASKALSFASDLGQKIYTLNINSISQLNSIEIDSQARAEIIESLRSNKVVIVHEKPIALGKWTGSGYVILDSSGAGAYKISGGYNGSETTSSNLLIGSGALLAVTDTYAGKKTPTKPWFSESLKKIWKQGLASKATGYLGLGVSILMALTDDSLAWSDKLAQISMNLLGFGVTAYVASALVAATAIPLVAAVLLSVLIAMALAVAVTYINSYYFSMSTWRLKPDLRGRLT